jgi:hypothetical protein
MNETQAECLNLHCKQKRRRRWDQLSNKAKGHAMGLGSAALQERQRALRTPVPDSTFLINSTKGPLTGTDWALTVVFLLSMALGTVLTIRR